MKNFEFNKFEIKRQSLKFFVVENCICFQKLIIIDA